MNTVKNKIKGGLRKQKKIYSYVIVNEKGNKMKKQIKKANGAYTMNILKNTLICGTIISLIGTGGLISTKVSAATTEGSIEFTENNGATKPTNPTNPSEELPLPDPDNPSTGNVGNLTLDVAPKAFNFGSQSVSNAAQKYQAIATTSGSQYLQVTDSRADQHGWTVTVQQDDYLNDGSNTLTGSTITIPKGVARNSLNVDPTIEDASLVTKEVAVTSAAQTIFQSPDTASVGKDVSVNVWDSANVSIAIPKLTAKAGSFSNTLTWTLTAGVTN